MALTAADYVALMDAATNTTPNKVDDPSFFQKAGNFLSGDAGKAIAAGIGGLFGLAGGGGDTQGSQGYTGGIPEYTTQRELVPGVFDPTGRRPGEAGRRYFTDTQYIPKTDAAGIQTVMGGDYLAQLNADALARQQQGEAANQGLLQALIANQMMRQASTTGTTPTTSPIKETSLVQPIDVLPKTEIIPTQPTAPEGLAGGAVGDAVYEPAYNTVKQMLRTIRSKYGNLAKPAAIQEVADMMNRFGITPDTMAKITGYDRKAIADQYAAAGYAQGGIASLGGQGYYLGGTTDGMADKVPATIDGREPARLSDGEFVIPADVVGHLGNGNSDAGAKQLYSMMDRIRKDRTGTTRQGKQINPNNYLMG